ncbi:hypothetical protein ACH5RR_035057 [Cinchona calisaya]|uniref:CST complex subunit CTC1 n=1 Tax=Cinchona calisaya TaxID=153742 RepID=A0ABD2YE21_9GENT
MEAETAKILKISDLISRARPLSGISSLYPGRNVPSDQPRLAANQPPKPFSDKPTSQNPEFKILKPLSHPTILIGTLALPPEHRCNNHNANSTIHCSCFQFTDGDGSATICCDILDFHPQLLGKKIRVCAWNFIPFKVGCDYSSGFLEIIRWELLECSSNSIEFSLAPASSTEFKNDSKAKYSIFGVLETVSPVSVVPCLTGGSSSSGNDPISLCGFLVKMLVCECRLCNSRKAPLLLGDLCEQSYKNHCFMKPLIVYFHGSASSWHQVIVRLVRSVVSFSGLKKKLVYITKDDSELMYVTSNKAFLQLPEMAKKCIPNEKVELRGKGEVGSYAGTVTGVYMQGMAVELDQEVMLLLTDHQLIIPHSVRVGAVVSVRNVHFVSTKFSWTKTLVLGACSITCICVESFSPLETGCHKKSHSQNFLRRFVDSLAFSARLWVLLIVTCFRKKFAGILSEKEILGSKHKVGLAQSYATSNLPASAYLIRPHGVFVEYCKHGLCAYGNKGDYSLLKLVVPISCFKRYFENRWVKMLLDREKDFDIMGSIEQRNSLSCCGRSYAKLLREIFQSYDTGIILLGNLKVSPSSGKLQLVDATGSIDVVTPDTTSRRDFNRIYEVEDFTVVMQGVPDKKYCLEISPSEPFTCRSIFESAPLERELKLSLFIYYHFRHKISENDSSSSKNCEGSFQEFEGGTFHLLWLKHKFPLLHKCLGDQVVSNRSSAFAEAIIMPWDLTLPESDQIAHFTGLPLYDLRNVEKLEKQVGLERCKRLRDAGNSECSDLNNSCHSAYCTEKKHCDLNFPLKFPCLISSVSFKCPCQGFVHCTDKKAMTSSGCKPNGKRVLLEFDSQSLYMYQRIRIGAYYMVKHHRNDVICAVKDDNNVTAVPVSSETYLWSLSFSSDVVLKNSDPSSVFRFCNSSVSNVEILPDASQQFEIPPPKFSPISPEYCSDFNVCLPADIVSYLKIGTSNLESGLMKPSISLQDEGDVYDGNGVVVTTPVVSSGTSHSDLLLPEGNLLSLHGRVVAIHDSNGASFDSHLRSKSCVKVHQPIISQGTTIICIHVLVDHHTAMIFGALGKHTYPTGFGPGVDATFHRILVLGGENQYMLIPASFIVIDSANIIDYWCIDEGDSVSDSIVAHNSTSPGVYPAAFISEILHCVDFRPVQLHCRVVGLYVLVLQKNKKAGYSSTRVQSYSSLLDIPLAGFILDDGSSTCCCWANHERAANMLRLPTEASSKESCTKTSRRFEIPVTGKANGSSAGHLNRILRQHGRVVIKNYGSMFDSSCLDLSFSVDNGEVICSSDENILRCLIMNACFSTLWTVVGSLMDSTATHQLEKELSEMDMTVLPLQNIWASGVYHSDPLTESRILVHGLVNR